MPKSGFLCLLLFSAIYLKGMAQTSPSPHHADSLYQQGNFPEAAAAYQDLVNSWKSLNNTDSANYYQFLEAKSYRQFYEYQKTRSLLQEILSSPDASPDSALLSQIYHEIGFTYLSENEIQKALEFSGKSINTEQARAKPDTFQLAKYYELKGFMLMQANDFEGAKQWATTAHQLRKSVLDPMDKELGYSANTLYIILSTMGELYSADTVLSEAWKILNHNLPEDHPHIAIIANNYSSHLMDMGDPQNAKKYLLKAISSNKQGERYYPLATNYVNLGLLYLNLGESKTAESYYNLAWNIVDTLLAYPDYYRANTKDALGAVYLQEGQLEKADSMFISSLKEKQDMYERESPEIAQSIFNLGLVASAQENWENAKKYYQESEGIRARVMGADHPKRADVLFELGEISWTQGKSAEALAQWRHSLQIYAQHFGITHLHTLQNLIWLSEVFDGMNQPDSVQHYLKLAWGGAMGQNVAVPNLTTLDSFSIARYTPEVLDLANFHLRLMLNKGDALSADDLKTIQQVFNSVHTWLPDFLSLFNDASLRENVAEIVQDFYRQAAVLANRALSIHGSNKAIWQMQLLNCIQASRGATIQAAFKDREAIRFAGVPDSLVQRTQELRQQLQYTLARQQNAEEDELNPLANQQQMNILQSWQEFQQFLQQNYPQYYQARFETSSVNREKMQQTLEDGNYSVLAYFNLDSALLAVHLQPDNFTTSWLTMPSGWQDSLEVYQQLLQRQKDVTRQARLGHFLYKKLWEPLALPTQSQINVLADGPLFYFNFETLLTQEVSNQKAIAAWPWLIKDYCLFYGHTLPGTVSTPNVHHGDILGIAPGFSQDLKSRYVNSLSQNQTPDSLFLDWLRTPWSLSFVQQLQNNGWGTALTEQAATEDLFLKQAPQASILHFGTHARLENDKPLYSFLALTPDPKTQQDGYLYTYELYNEPLKAQLAVLTACETGLGTYRRGEGVLSLAHAFRYAGCPSVVYSLWSIDDQQSNQIAELFYENLQKDMTFAEALRAAKLSYLAQADINVQSPYFWAGLVLTGDDQSVNLSSSPLKSWIVWLGSGMLLLGIIWFVIQRRRQQENKKRLKKI